MCQFILSKTSIEIAHLIDFDDYFATELRELESFAESGLLAFDGPWIVVTPKGRMLIRNICMVFDKYLRHEVETRRYSRVI
jgi:oxygen-independent coproporphyrinogen-3 oxidase